MATAQQLVSLATSNAADHVRFERRLDDHDHRLEKIEKAAAPILTERDFGSRPTIESR